MVKGQQIVAISQVLASILGFYSLTKRSLKGSYSVSKGGATCLAPVGSPGPAPIKVAFPNYFQFSWVPPAKVPYQISFRIL